MFTKNELKIIINMIGAALYSNNKNIK